MALAATLGCLPGLVAAVRDVWGEAVAGVGGWNGWGFGWDRRAPHPFRYDWKGWGTRFCGEV